MYKRIVIAALAASLLTACGGGTVSAPSVVIPPAPPGATTTSFVISTGGAGGETIASGGARPAYVSASARSISYAVDGGTTSTQDLTATASNCAAANGGVRCTVPLAGIAPGTHALALTVWDGANGTGDKLGANANIGFTVVANQANVVSGVVGGIATGLDLVPVGPGASGSVAQGFTMDWSAKPQTFIANPLDAGGNAIVGPGAPVVTVGPTNADLSTAAGALPNSFVVTATNPNNCGPSPCDRGDALRLTVTPSTGSGGSTLNVTVRIFAITTYVYVVDADGTVQAFDDSGTALAEPSASAEVNVTGGVVALAFDPATVSLMAIQGPNVITYDYTGHNIANELGQGTAVLGSAFTWNPVTGAAYGWDTVARTMVRLDAGAKPAAVTPIGPNYAPGPTNAFVAYATDQGNAIYSSANIIFAATTTTVYSSSTLGVISAVYGANNVGTVDGLAYDPISTNLWVAGSTGLGYYPEAADNLAATPVADANGPTGIAIDPFNDFAYVADATGHVRVFDQHGVPRFSFATAAGTHPVQILIAP